MATENLADEKTHFVHGGITELREGADVHTMYRQKSSLYGALRVKARPTFTRN